jgi:predicted metal-dependent phosphoesterase TrpH
VRLQCASAPWRLPITIRGRIPAAREEIERAGLALKLISGVEISTVWENHEIHIVGLNIDIEIRRVYIFTGAA